MKTKQTKVYRFTWTKLKKTQSTYYLLHGALALCNHIFFSKQFQSLTPGARESLGNAIEQLGNAVHHQGTEGNLKTRQ